MNLFIRAFDRATTRELNYLFGCFNPRAESRLACIVVPFYTLSNYFRLVCAIVCADRLAAGFRGREMIVDTAMVIFEVNVGHQPLIIPAKRGNLR